MIALTLKLNGDGSMTDLQGKKFVHLSNDAPPMQIVVLDKGMTSGRPSVALRFDLPDGQTVIAETSARLFVSAGRAIHAKYPDLFED